MRERREKEKEETRREGPCDHYQGENCSQKD
jgi:hypothetical protein